MSNTYKFEDGPFLFNDGEFHFWALLEFDKKDPFSKRVRWLGTVRVRVGDSPILAAKKKFPNLSYQLVVPWKSTINRWRKKHPHKVLYKAPYRLNRALCKGCRDVVESMHRHDYVHCACGQIAVDGGYDYARRTGEPILIEEMP